MVKQAVGILLTRQEREKDLAFNRTFGQKPARREMSQELALEEEQCEKRIERARSFMFKAVRFSSMLSGA